MIKLPLIIHRFLTAVLFNGIIVYRDFVLSLMLALDSKLLCRLHKSVDNEQKSINCILKYCISLPWKITICFVFIIISQKTK